MKQIKFGILGAGVIGLISIFLPYISAGPISMKFWDFRKMPAGMSGLLNGPNQVYIALIGFLAAAVVAGLAVAGKRLIRWQAIVGLVGFLLAFATGGKLLFLAALIGVVASIAGIAKPEKA